MPRSSFEKWMEPLMEGDAHASTPLKRAAPVRGAQMGRLKPTKMTAATNTFKYTLSKL
jgi:hypothetical protein